MTRRPLAAYDMNYKMAGQILQLDLFEFHKHAICLFFFSGIRQTNNLYRQAGAALFHRYDVIRSREVIGHVAIRLSIDDFMHVLNEIKISKPVFRDVYSVDKIMTS